MTAVLERCEDCRRICLCHRECACMTVTAEGDSVALLCHSCTDKGGAR